MIKKDTFRLDQLAGITISGTGLVQFSVWSEREDQTQRFQYPGWIDIYTFMRGAYGLNKTTYSFNPTKDKTVVIQSGSQRYILTYV